MSSGVVNTSKVTGRRTVRYESFDELLADAERLATVPVLMLGNWSQGQIYHHLAMAIDTMIDGPAFLLPAPLRWVARTFLKKRMLTRTLDPGFKLPRRAEKMIASPTITTAEGLDELRRAVNRINATSHRGLHPGFGKVTREEWDQFQWRHCEMHMSFIVPATP